jgi:hypothetical protein
MESRGLGDTIAKITEATGIKKVVDTISDITGVPCNCSRRQETLNNWVPYNNTETPINELVEQNIDDFGEGIYIFNGNLIITRDGITTNYKKGDRVLITKENHMINDFKQYFKLGIISKE